MKTGVKRFSQAAFALLMGLTLGAVVARAQDDPRLRVVHASPDAPAADVYVSGNPVFNGVSFGGISSYELLPAGNHTIRVLPAGAGSEIPPVIETTLPFIDGKDYTFVAVGKLDNLQPWQLTDENDVVPQSGEARIRIVHTSPDAQALDICLAGTDDCWITNLTFKNTSGNIALRADSYNVDIRRTDTKEVVRNQPDLRFEEGGIYSVFVMGLLGGDPGLQLISSRDAQHTPPTPPPTPPPPDQPPETGAFLSPTAFALLTIIILSVPVIFLIVRRQVFRA